MHPLLSMTVPNELRKRVRPYVARLEIIRTLNTMRQVQKVRPRPLSPARANLQDAFVAAEFDE